MTKYEEDRVDTQRSQLEHRASFEYSKRTISRNREDEQIPVSNSFRFSKMQMTSPSIRAKPDRDIQFDVEQNATSQVNSGDLLDINKEQLLSPTYVP